MRFVRLSYFIIISASLRHKLSTWLQRRHVPWAKPYLHPALVSVLHQCFFAGSGSIGSKHASRFTSSLAERPDEKEIPMAMLALVGTAVGLDHTCQRHRVLTDHSARFMLP